MSFFLLTISCLEQETMQNNLQLRHEKPAYPPQRRNKNFKDISNQRFGRWLVLYLDETKDYKKAKNIYWMCKCDCGTIRSVSGARLRKGGSKSCGCYQRDMNFIDLEGQFFGRLYVLDMSEKTQSGRGKPTYWSCKCVCGNFVHVPTSQLLNGDSTSCGCKTRKVLPNGLKKYEYPEKKLELWNLDELECEISSKKEEV